MVRWAPGTLSWTLDRDDGEQVTLTLEELQRAIRWYHRGTWQGDEQVHSILCSHAWMKLHVLLKQ